MSDVHRIIFFVESQFSARDYSRFGIELLVENGFEVEVWDFTPWLHPEVQKKVTVPDPISFYGLHQFWSSGESVLAIRGLSTGCLVVLLIGYCLNSFILYKALSSNRIRYAVFMANNLPAVDIRADKISFAKRLRNLKLNKVPSAIFTRMPYLFWGIRPANIVLAGGESSLISISYPVGNSTKYLWIHTLDYDIYLDTKGRFSVKDTYRDMCVFLDEYLPFHPDFFHLKIQPPASAEDYYPLMCTLFDRIEKELNIEVIIAAHPRSHYGERDPLFGGRQVIRGSTFDLVRSTRFVIAHSSTSINFAVMLEKPIVFITTDKLTQSNIGPYIENISELLGKNEINLDARQSIDWEREMTVDIMAYATYKNDYIKKGGTDNLLFWQIVSNYLHERVKIT